MNSLQKNGTSVNDGSVALDLKAFRLDTLNFAECFPAEFDQNLWYGVYFINGCDYKQPGECNPSIVLLNAGFDFIDKHLSRAQQGFLILFSHNFLPQQLNKKLHHLPLFFQQGCGPFLLNLQQLRELDLLCNKIHNELRSDYRFKKELLATLIIQLLHFVIKNFTSKV